MFRWNRFTSFLRLAGLQQKLLKEPEPSLRGPALIKTAPAPLVELLSSGVEAVLKNIWQNSFTLLFMNELKSRRRLEPQNVAPPS
jgi:hypothetical protein